MPDLCYIVMCNHSNPPNGKVVYQNSEPQQESGTHWHGGFSIHITKATLYPDRKSAKKMRDKAAKCYPDYDVRIITKNVKELFIERLVG